VGDLNTPKEVAMRRRTVLHPPILVVTALLLSPSAVPRDAGAETVVVEQELIAGGNNYDDPCFWQDPNDSEGLLACITSKDDDLVECFALPSGTFVGTATGFDGAANNCDVDPVRNEMVTTDNGGDRVLVHRLPDLGAPVRELTTAGFGNVTGICVGHEDGRSLVFVTDEDAGQVFVLDAVSGEEVRSFPHELSKAEGIACDDDRHRVYVCDDESDSHSCRAFTFGGEAVGEEFGIAETASDSEGVAIYRCGPEDGYIIVSDQSRDEFEVFERQEPFRHLCTFDLEVDGDQTDATDGIDVVQVPAFPGGLFGACDGCSGGEDQLDLVRWERIAEACGLRVCSLGVSGEAACGDGVVNRAGEDCDGTSDAACPGACRPDCTCGGNAAPVCGDARINDAAEECDGPDDTLCPGRCRTSCTCPPAQGEVRAAVLADASVRQASPGTNRNARLLEADARSPKESLLRIRVQGVEGRAVVRARLRLTVGRPRQAGGSHGGEIYVTSCAWEEHRVTWQTKPALVGAPLDVRPGRVAPRDRVTFDLTGHIPGDGDYCVALTSPSRNAVRYESRERRRGPVVEIVLEGEDTAPTCGDGLADQPAEQCDGADAATCPGRCRSDCTCPAGDGGGDAFSCVSSGADVVLDGLHSDAYYTRSLPPGTVVDATQATFVHCTQPPAAEPCTQNEYPVNLGPTTAPGVCWSGGLVAGANRADASWDEMHDPNNAGFIFENPDFTVQGVRIHNVGDGIRPREGATDFTITDVWLSRVRDDCVENDHLNGGVVNDSLFDGCFVGFSARHSSPSESGAENLWIIQSSLVRLEEMPGPPDGGDVGHKGFFKWISWGDPTSPSPRLALYDNVFMAEGYGDLSSGRMGIPPGKLADCANNTMVWLGDGEYPDQLPSCFTVVRDRQVWERARADWIARHPGFSQPLDEAAR
jgi:hypothetical protein